MPASKVTSCCFGGENLDTLYITTAREHTDTTKEPLAGGIFQADVGARGYAPSYFSFGKKRSKQEKTK